MTWKLALAALGVVAFAGAAQAQTKVPGDPYVDDPSGIMADPCPAHAAGSGGDYQMRNLHMLTRDFGQLCRYRAQDLQLEASHAPVRVVFMGDSITDNWDDKVPQFFGPGLVNRGIGGQTTAQMLVRFRQDVIDLHPQAVHIMAGTNDIAGNTGAETMATLEGNIETMAELAKLHGIKVILASVPPAAAFPWAKDKQPVPQIAAFNRWQRAYAAQHGYTYVDYFAAMAGPDGGMKPGISIDGVHPNEQGYAIMQPLTRAAITRTLGR